MTAGPHAKSQEQRNAEADVNGFRQERGPFVVAAETTRMPMLFTDAKEPENPIIFANDSFLQLTGYAREDVLAMSFNSLMAPGATREALQDVAAAFEGASIDPEVHCRRKDGSWFWASIFVNAVRDGSGAIVQHFVSIVDLTERKQEQVQSRMLIDELNHRVKNTLSTVQSIVWQALRRPATQDVIRESIESRLIALARSHDLLTRHRWEDVELRDLVETALRPFEAVARTQHFVITGEDIRLSAKITLALGIALHELATNAVKYGAFSNGVGHVEVKWAAKVTADGDRLFLCWKERDGPPVKQPTHKGFGSQVIVHGLEHELGGKVRLDYCAEGLRCMIDIPQPRGAFDG